MLALFDAAAQFTERLSRALARYGVGSLDRTPALELSLIHISEPKRPY